MSRHRLVVVLIDGVLPLDMAIPMHVFARETPESYDVVTASLTGGPVPVAGGMAVVPDGGLGLLDQADTVIVPGYEDAADRPVHSATTDALGTAAWRGVRMASICSGAFALAQTGLLDGLTATTHWSLCDALAAQHPRITVDPSVMYVDNDTVLTSGGVTAGVDLCLHILAKDLGPAAARHVSCRLVMAARHDEDQRQFTEPRPIATTDETIATTQQWMRDSLAAPLTVAQMAAHAHMSERTFHRRFTEAAGSTPLAWLRDQRIARAKHLLETTDHPIESISHQTGLGTPANLRTHFRQATSLSPQQYRHHFTYPHQNPQQNTTDHQRTQGRSRA